jgi:hypothetical protein
LLPDSGFKSYNIILVFLGPEGSLQCSLGPPAHLGFGVPSGISHSEFATHIFHAFRNSTVRAISLDHLILFDFINLIILSENYLQMTKMLIMKVLQPPVISPNLSTNIFLSLLFSGSLNPYLSHRTRDQVSCLYKTLDFMHLKFTVLDTVASELTVVSLPLK